MKKISLVAIAALLISTAFAQDTISAKPKFTWTVFADAYYSYDFNQPGNLYKSRVQINFVMPFCDCTEKMLFPQKRTFGWMQVFCRRTSAMKAPFREITGY